MRLALVHAGISDPSSSLELGELLAQYAHDHLSSLAPQERLHIEVVAIKNLGHDLVSQLTERNTSAQLAQALELVSTCDCIIAVTPVYQASYAGLFKMFFDALPPRAIEATPVLLAANAGSKRHALVLEYAVRPLFAYLRARTVPTGILVTPEDHEPQRHADLVTRMKQATHELVTLALE